MKTRYDQIVKVEDICTRNGAGGVNAIIELAEKEQKNPASGDERKVLLLGIDNVIAFMENIGSLAVPNSKQDIKNLTMWMYKNLNRITTICMTTDVHAIFQIFHPAWWVDKNGNHPPIYTVISCEEVINGEWIPIYGSVEDTIHVLSELETKGKRQLCIWPYHAIDLTDETCLEYELAKMVTFHSVVRKQTPFVIRKGQDPYSEMYGVIAPEVGSMIPMGKKLLEMIEEYDVTVIAGEAKSHCVLESIIQILEYFGPERRDVTEKLVFLDDCSSSISGYEDETESKLKELQEKYGIKIVKSTEFNL